MRKISAWAGKHSTVSITLIVFLKIVLGLLAIYTGIALSKQAVIFPPSALILSSVLLAIIYFCYYAKKHSYARRKLMEFLFITIAFTGLTAFFNRLDHSPQNPAFAIELSGVIAEKKKPSADQVLASLPYRDKSSLTREEKRVLKKEFGIQLKKYIAAGISGDKEGSKRSGLIILAIIGALGVTLLLSALVCSLSCNGADGAAILVAVLGLVGIIWGTSALIKHIKRKHPK